MLKHYTNQSFHSTENMMNGYIQLYLKWNNENVKKLAFEKCCDFKW